MRGNMRLSGQDEKKQGEEVRGGCGECVKRHEVTQEGRKQGD